MLSEKQIAVRDFLEASEYLRQIADDGQGRGMLEFTESFIQSVASFGVSELYAREAERYLALGLSKRKANYSLEKSKHHHEKGLRAVGYAKNALNQFRKDLEEYPTDMRLDERDISELIQGLNEQLADLDIKRSDAEKISKTLQEGMHAIAREGAQALPDYLEERIEELAKLRSQEDRGAVENIPVWKVAAIAVALGVWIWALFRCKWWGSCRLKEGLGYFIVFWIAVYIAKFC